MKSNNLAVIVPVDPTGSGDSLKTQVWATVTKLLTRYLGKYYGSFFPVKQAWDCKIENGFGIVLGKEKPLDFLNLYAEAQQLQQKSQGFHLGFLLEEIKKRDDGCPVIPIVIDQENEGLLFHLAWKLMAENGVIFPDYGIFYAEQNRAFVSEDVEQKIISHLADYAICVVCIAPMEDGHDSIPS